MTFPFSRKSFTEETQSRKVALGSALSLLLELVQVLAISLAIIIPVRYFLVQPFYVKGASMEPSFFDHEYLIIDELSYRFTQPERGDIVVFRYPADPKQFFIKRVIGLPGETVEVAGGQIKIYNDKNPNGVVLDETKYLDQMYTAMTRTVTLKNNEYYVMGDNRVASLDSRIFGPVERSSIVGRVWLRGWPLDRWKLFQDQTYQSL
ncbi:signal peptidase I [Candidatus Uhrbacteria bacterium]|nr:signal peptidase I [Candidatus Uhrbacteria bacterium]